MLPRLTIVLSTGRSGTSLLTQLFSRLGAVIPQPEVAPDEANPQGYGEPAWLVDFQQIVLHRAAVHNSDGRPSAWHAVADVVASDPSVETELRRWLKEQLAGGKPLIVKDPRSIWLMDLWQRCASSVGVEPVFAVMARHPAAVVASKQTWFDQAERPLSLSAGWVNIMLHSERQSRGSKRMITTYENLCARPAETLQHMAAQAGFDLDPALVQSATGSLDRRLARSSSTDEIAGIRAPLDSLLTETWQGLDGLAANPAARDSAAEQKLDETRAGYDSWYEFCELVTASSIRAAELKGKASVYQPWTLQRRIRRVAGRAYERFERPRRST